MKTEHDEIINSLESFLQTHFEHHVNQYSAVLFGQFVKDCIVRCINTQPDTTFFLREFLLTISDIILNSEVNIEALNEKNEIKLFLEWFNRGDEKPMKNR